MPNEKELQDLMDLVTSSRKVSEGPEALRASKDLGQLRRVTRQENVVGIGVAAKVTSRNTLPDLGLTYYVLKKVPPSKLRAAEAIPSTVRSPRGNAVATDVVVIGVIRPEVNARRTPISPGYSVGHISGDTGTLGSIVMRDGRYFLLSNSHVLAMCGKAKRGDIILYPGIDDGGKKTKDVIAKLADFVKLKKRGVNTVDTAIAEIDADRIEEVMAKIRGIGLVKATTKPKIGMKVEKVGRTSGKTTGTVISSKFRPLRLPYPEIGDISFEDQILITRFTKPGDSGSLVIDSKSKKAIGLHFAGAKGGSISAPINRVLELMDVRLVTRDL
jgi:hypothetical protein